MYLYNYIYYEGGYPKMNIDEKTTQPTKPIPEPTLRRLPIYYQYLKKMHDDKQLDHISCTNNRQ